MSKEGETMNVTKGRILLTNQRLETSKSNLVVENGHMYNSTYAGLMAMPKVFRPQADALDALRAAYLHERRKVRPFIEAMATSDMPEGLWNKAEPYILDAMAEVSGIY